MESLAVPGLNCDLFRSARAIRAVTLEFCDLSNLTAIEAVHLIAKGELRAEEYALRLMERYRALKSLNAVTWMGEERVLESARAIDHRRERGEPIGMLGGLPVLIKDDIEVPGTLTAAASAILAKDIRDADATVAQRLFDAGAVFFGTANMDELAGALARRLVPAGLGTDMIGSRTVADVALLHAAITGRPPAPRCDLRATRIGVPTAAYWEGIDLQIARVAHNALIRLQAAGVELVEVDARAVEAYEAMFTEHRLAAIVFPTRPRQAPLGLSIPAGLTAQGLPVGLEFDALAGYDSELLALGIAVEQAWPAIPPPQPIG
jgi:Asp-tRNA(Asn)/Glu-tRNA(Gln) amidotransferase A subunit family amidase